MRSVSEKEVASRCAFESLVSAFAGLVLASCPLSCGSSQSSSFTDSGTASGSAHGDAAVLVDSSISADSPILIVADDATTEAGADGSVATQIFMPTGPVTDFPSPIFDGTAPTDSPTLFGGGDGGATGGGPCIVEPENDVLYPQNWLRPRFTWTAATGQNLFELRLHVQNQIKDLVVYTSATQWTMPLAQWNALRADSPTEPMTLTVTGGVYDGTTLTGAAQSSSYTMSIAPVQATGAIVYWTTSDNSALKGFSIGDESVVPVLVPDQVAESATTCIGCHTAAPGGTYVGLTISGTSGQDYPNALALIQPDAGTIGSVPPFLGAGGAAALARDNLGISTFSEAHWTTGDRRTVVAYDDTSATSPANVLTWIDVEATALASASGTIARTGDPNSAGAPSWSHDGNTIAYVSTNKFCSGRLGAGCNGDTSPYNGQTDPGSTAAIYTVPYSGGAGGTATALPGASSASAQQYYPAFSPDDHWIAFDLCPLDLNLYDQSAGEVYVIPSAGGTATRLEANTPPACSGAVSPGVTNSWPKWGPTALEAGGSTYYWLVFSSTRSAAAIPQLYVTGVVQTGSTIQTHGSLYLWNQPATESNHTPAWDTFKVQPQPPPTLPK
jgi:hypothetical protein